MRRIKGVLLLLATGVSSLSHAQEVSVFSAKDKKPVPYTHVTFSIPGAVINGETVLTNNEGRAKTPASMQGKTVAIAISAIGYERIKDTLRAGESKTYYLNESVWVLNELVVTGQYSPNNPEQAIQKVRIIDRKKIEAMAAVTLKDVLQNELNIRLSQDNILGSSMTLQGISGENIKILIDGVPMTGRLNGSIDLSQINLDNIERIEVIEGPLSVNYGSNALAGTINLITKKETTYPFMVGAQAYTESIGQYNVNGLAQAQWKKHGINLSGGRNYFAGWNPDGPMFPGFSTPVADSSRYKSWKPKEQYFGRLQYFYTGQKVQLSYRLEAFDEMIINRGMPRMPYRETAFDDRYQTWRLDNAVHADIKTGERKGIKIISAWNHYRRIKNSYFRDLTTLEERPLTQDGSHDTTRLGLFNTRITYSSDPDSSKFGYELGTDITYETMYGLRIEGEEKKMGDYALFGSLEYRPLSSLSIRGGMRYAYNTLYQGPPVPSLNVRWKMNKLLTLRVSYARGFRSPSLKEMYFYFVDINHHITGNPNLKPEYSHHVSSTLSGQQTYSKWIIRGDIGGFYNDINQLITLAQRTGTEYTYVNIGKYRTVGGQANIGFIFEHLRVNVGGSYTGRYNQVSELHPIDPFSFYPEVRANAMYEWKKTGLSLSFFYKYQGRMPGFMVDASGNAAATFIQAYHTADVSLGKSWWKDRTRLSIGCKNLFDVQSVNSTLAGEAHSMGATSVPVATGRLYFIKLEVRWWKEKQAKN